MLIKSLSYNSFIVASLSDFGKSVILSLENEFGSVPSLSIKWKSFRGVDIISSSKF
jgi:hypothetical protein